jgi:filamin
MNGAKGDPRAHVETPGSTEDDVFVQELDQDTYALRFLPKENGVHYVHVKLNEAHIPGSPFPMLVGEMGADPALVLASGDGLEKGTAGTAAKFFVTTTNAGSGTLGVTIEGPSKCAIVCTEQDEGYEFSYTPMAPGDYLISIKYCNITIAGCPTKAKIGGKGKASDVTETSGLAVETVEKKPGAKKTKKFTGDASKVTARGAGLKKCFMNRPATFNIDVKDAGNALLTVAMISSNGCPAGELSYKKQRATVYQVTFKAAEKGEHQLFVRWGTDDIPGSPFVIDVV